MGVTNQRMGKSETNKKKLEYIEYIQREWGRALSAKKLGLKKCQRCGWCCIGGTCTPQPSEIEPIAKFLGLTNLELVRKYMVIDKANMPNYFLRFAKEGQEDITGLCLPEERRFDHGYCILFDKGNKACKIYKVRPLEARDWNCWDAESNYLCSDGASAWGKGDVRRFVPGFQP